MCLLYEHHIPIAVEAIALLDGVGVGALHHVQAHQRADQHEQGRARQVEVGDEAVGRLEAIAGGDEDGGVALERPHAPRLVGGAFEQAERGGADGDQPSAALARRVEPLRRGGVDPTPFAVHHMVVGIVRLDRQERARADMQRERFATDSERIERIKQFGREVQRRRRGRVVSVRVRQ